MKRCSKCKESKPLDAFSPARQKRPSAQCRACESADRIAWEHRTTTPERREAKSEYLKQWRAANPDYQAPSQMTEARRAWRAANPEKSAEYARRYRDKDPQRARDVQRRFQQNHPEKFAHKSAKRRARKLLATGSHTEEEWQEVLRRHKFRCVECGAKGKPTKRGGLTRDHIIPLSRGGTDFAFNLQPLCQPCNSRKHTRIDPGTQHSLFDQVNKEDAA